MPDRPTTAPSFVARRPFSLGSSSLAVGTCFLTMGFVIYSLMTRLPEIKTALALGEQTLGFALLGLSFGGYLATIGSGFALQRLGPSRSSGVAVSLVCAGVVLPSLATGAFVLFLLLLLLGLFDGFLNVAMNATATNLEQAGRVNIMTSCHGLFSLGGMLGAASSGYFAQNAVPLPTHLLLIGGLLFVLNWLQRRALVRVPTVGDPGGAGFAWPTRAMWGVCFICFSSSMAEGIITDWTAIYFREDLRTSALVAGLAVSLFAGTAAVCRFGGDVVRRRLSAPRMLRFGCLLAGWGLCLMTFASSTAWGLAGLVLIAIGNSTIVPICYVLGAQTPGVSTAYGIAAVAGIGILGFFIGPTYMGYLAEHYGMTVGYAGMAGLLFAAFALSFRLAAAPMGDGVREAR